MLIPLNSIPFDFFILVTVGALILWGFILLYKSF